MALLQAFVVLGLVLSVPISREVGAVSRADVVVSADSLLRAGRVPEALATLDAFLRAPGSRSDPLLRRRALVRRARILALGGRLEQARASASEALAAAEAARDSALVSEALRWKAYATGGLGYGVEAERLWTRLEVLARARADPEHEAYAHFGLGYVAERTGDSRRALGEYARAASLFRSLGLPPYDLWALSAEGNAARRLADIAGARRSYGEVIDVARRRGDIGTEIRALNDLGSAEFELGDPGTALRLYETAVATARSHDLRPEVLTPLRNSALALTYLGHLDDAAARLEQGLAESARLGLPAETSELLEQLGYVRSQQQRMNDAVRSFRRAMAIDDSLGRLDNADPAMGLAACLAAMDSMDVALDVYERRLEPRLAALRPYDRMLVDRSWADRLEEAGRPSEGLAHARAADQAAARLGVGGQQWAMRVTAARCARALGHPDSALAWLERAARDWEAVRVTQREPEWRERIGDVRREVYTELADLLLEHPAELSLAERTRHAFEAAQRFKARTLYERAHGASGEPLPPPAYTAIGLRVLQRDVLRPGEALVDAYFGRRRAVLFVVTRDTCIGRRLPIEPRGLPARLGRLHALLATRPEGDAAARATLLETSTDRLGPDLFGDAALLLAPMQRVYFCLDGALTTVPARLFVSSTGGSAVEREIVYVPSATMLAEWRRALPGHEVPRARGRLLVLSSALGVGGRKLPGVEREARWLRHRYVTVAAGSLIGLGVARGTRAAGGAPSLRGFEALHVTAHTALDDQRPWLSGIGLPVAGSGDSLLRAERIAQMRLPFGLVVLSACESAGQLTPSGEGMLGLSSAFLASGARAVVATLWPVSDLATAEFTERLYEGLERGETVASALRSAQRAMAARSRTRDPFYWSGFVVIGDGDVRVALKQRVRIWSLVLPVAGLLLVAGVVAGGLVRRRSAVTAPAAGTPSP